MPLYDTGLFSYSFPFKDSNLNPRLQRPMCCRYTKGERVAPTGVDPVTF